MNSPFEMQEDQNCVHWIFKFIGIVNRNSCSEFMHELVRKEPEVLLTTKTLYLNNKKTRNWNLN